MDRKNQVENLKRDVLVNLIRAFKGENFEKDIDKIPFIMRPKNMEVPYRCCIHKERAILRERTISSLGFSLEDDDEMTYLSEYAKRALVRETIDNTILTVLDMACKGCIPSRIFVTDMCQGCVARPCVQSCNFGAISIVNDRSVIDYDKCKKCTKCMQVCPYSAIAKTTVPCEQSCPVGAIKKDKNWLAKIDFNKCIGCGACTVSCPFGAVHEKSQIIDILNLIKTGKKKLVAMIAPSVVGQFDVSLAQLAGGLKKAGFSTVMEVALGADMTAKHEAKDFEQRMQKGDDFMTTSCCAAYIDMVKKHVPELQPYMSETPTPMHYIAEVAKEMFPDYLTVFIGPCVAKRQEGLSDEYVDFVMSFEEMEALFIGLDIDLKECESFNFLSPASAEGRNFGVTSGVANAVIAASDGNAEIKPVLINGLNLQAIRQMKSWAQSGKCPDGNLVEVMGCIGGCVGGACVINDKKKATKKIKELVDESNSIKSKADSMKFSNG